MSETLISVGIDIGTSTTQLVFSKLTVENTAAAWTVPTVKIVGKDVIYRSNIHTTPLLSSDIINAAQVKDIVATEYRVAGISPGEVQTGAVIITGETARKENAREVLKMLSGFAGDFVVATAGPDLEGILAGKGSGAWEYSKSHSCTAINFDIGGGTTNIAVFRNGEVMDSACFDVGGRLVKIDDGRVSYISEKVKNLSGLKGISLELGGEVNRPSLEKICELMAKTLVIAALSGACDDVYNLLITDHDLRLKLKPDAVFLSGGVADCALNSNLKWDEFGDMGVILGVHIRDAFNMAGLSLVTGSETIRATVVGAGNHTTEISGSTILYDKDKLPLKNIPVVSMTNDEERLDGKSRQDNIARRVEWISSQTDSSVCALSLKGKKGYGFDEIESLASDIAAGMKNVIEVSGLLIVLIEKDFAKALGLCLKRILVENCALICVDGISAGNGDYVDIGSPVAGGQVVPVVVKTLLFGY